MPAADSVPVPNAAVLPRLCVLVPCFNEQEALPVLVKNLAPALEGATKGGWRILFIDDGSQDNTARLIWELHERDARYTGIRLSRNFGHQPAVATGLRFAAGEAIGIIDCDLQDPVEVLVQLYEKVSSGQVDVAAGARGHREDAPLWLRIAYKGFYRAMNWMADHEFPLDSGDFCVFNRRVHRALLALPETVQVHRGLRSWVGFKQTAVTYRRPPRAFGRSKYNLGRLAGLAMSNVVSFSTFPLRLATWFGLVMGGLIALASVFFLINRFFPSFGPFGFWIGQNPGTTTLILYLSVIAAALFLCLGIMGEYLALIVREVKRRPLALVSEVTPGLEIAAAPPAVPGPFAQ